MSCYENPELSGWPSYAWLQRYVWSFGGVVCGEGAAGWTPGGLGVRQLLRLFLLQNPTCSFLHLRLLNPGRRALPPKYKIFICIKSFFFLHPLQWLPVRSRLFSPQAHTDSTCSSSHDHKGAHTYVNTVHSTLVHCSMLLHILTVVLTMVTFQLPHKRMYRQTYDSILFSHWQSIWSCFDRLRHLSNEADKGAAALIPRRKGVLAWIKQQTVA